MPPPGEYFLVVTSGRVSASVVKVQFWPRLRNFEEEISLRKDSSCLEVQSGEISILGEE